MVILGIFSINARCLRKRECYCTKESIKCIGLFRIPLVPIEFVKNITVLDFKKCRLSRLSQLRKLNSWPDLKVVDVRDQLTDFQCDIAFDFDFNILTDCKGITETYEMTSSEDNGTFIFETTSNIPESTTSAPETTGYDNFTLKPRLPVKPTTRETSTAMSTTRNSTRTKSTLSIKPSKRVFPKPGTKGLSTIMSSSTVTPTIKNLTTTSAKLESTPFEQKKDLTFYKLHALLIAMTVLTIVGIIFVIFMIIAYIYGGICTCMMKIRAFICMCSSCRRSHKDNDKDSDQGDENK